MSLPLRSSFNQRVDFYQRIGKESLFPKSLVLLGVAWLCVPVFYAFWAGYLVMSQEDSRQMLVEARAHNAQLLKQIEVLSSNKQSNNTKLLSQELLGLQHLHSEKQTLLSHLRDPQSSNLIGFSEIFRGLSRRHVQGVSLDKIEVTESGSIFYMSGTVSNPVDIPRYIVRLGEEEVFANMTFEKLRLKEKNVNEDVTENARENVDEDLKFEIRSISRI